MFSDPENYRQLSQPFESLDAADKAVQSFFSEVSELRKKHKITNLYLIVGSSVTTDTGEPEFLTTRHFGDSLKRESMVAYAFGQEQSERQELIGKLLSGKGIVHRGPKKEGKS